MLITIITLFHLFIGIVMFIALIGSIANDAKNNIGMRMDYRKEQQKQNVRP